MLSDFGYVLLFMITGGLFVGIALFVSKLVRPDRPSPVKLDDLRVRGSACR